MKQLHNYKNGLIAYRNGFGIGLLVGTGVCLGIGRPIAMLPLAMALLFGSVFFERKLNQDGKDDKK